MSGHSKIYLLRITHISWEGFLPEGSAIPPRETSYSFIKNGIFITNKLEQLQSDIDECWYCFDHKKRLKRTSDKIFDGFFCSEEEIFELIRKNEKWHDIERDLAIFKEKQKGKYLQELGENYGIDFTTVSVIVKKVQGAINYWKGKLF